MLNDTIPSTDQAADETAVYYKPTDGRPASTIARYGTRVVVTQYGVLISDTTLVDVPTTRAWYANWNCDPRVNDPVPGDVIEVAVLWLPVTVMVVMDMTVVDTQNRIYRVTGRTRPANGAPGRDMTITVPRHNLRFVSRPDPAVVSTATTHAVSAADVPAGSVPNPADRAVPAAPRFRPVTWTEHLDRQARRPVVRPPARPTVSATQRHAHASYVIRYEAGPDVWQVLREGRQPLSNPTQATLDGLVRHLAAVSQRDAERVQVTATVATTAGGTLFSVAVSEPTRRRQRAARRRYTERVQRAERGADEGSQHGDVVEWIDVEVRV